MSDDYRGREGPSEDLSSSVALPGASERDLERFSREGEMSLESILVSPETNETQPWKGPAHGWHCAYRHWRWLDKATGELSAFDCKSWACPVHAPRLGYRWYLRLAGVQWQLMLTFTLIPAAPAAQRLSWQRLARILRVWGMRTFVRVLEFGSMKGMAHWHVLTVGTGRLTGEQLERLRVEAARLGLGPRVHVGEVRSRQGAAHYVADYAAKDLRNLALNRFHGCRRITCSRDVPRYDAALVRDSRKERSDEVREEAVIDYVERWVLKEVSP